MGGSGRWEAPLSSSDWCRKAPPWRGSELAIWQSGNLAIWRSGKQGVVAPDVVAGDVHAHLALAGALDQEPVHVDDGLVEESVRLLGPDAVDPLVQPTPAPMVPSAGGEEAGAAPAGEVAQY
jgi:hypothetical protein